MPRLIYVVIAIAGCLINPDPSLAQVARVQELTKIEGGTFKLDKRHARIVFSTTHLGFSTYYGFFSDLDGTLDYDPKAPAESTLDVTVNLSGLVVQDAELERNLKSADYFDVATFPTARLRATKIDVSGAGEGTITGDLTLHGVTRPITLEAKLNGGGVNPVTQVYVLGFDATAKLSRSDFGIKTLVPFVGDEVTLLISCEFDRVK